MKVCVFGAGAIGGYLAAKLALAGGQVTCIVRGNHLKAIRKNGLTLIENERSETVEVDCTDRPQDAGPHDVVFVTLKSHAVGPAVEGIIAVLGADTVVVTANNGVPWWYFYGLDVAGSPELQTVDPGRRLWRKIGPERAIGCVVYPAARLTGPGIVEHIFGNRFAIGEPDGSNSARLRSLSAMLVKAGLDAPVSADIRSGIWTKLVANASYNPVSLLTGSTLGEMIDDNAVCRLMTRMMDEAIAVAAASGATVPLTADELLQATRPFGEHKTSMLQDFEVGRAVELDPIVGAVQELGRLNSVPTPTIDTILALARQKAELAGCYSTAP